MLATIVSLYTSWHRLRKYLLLPEASRVVDRVAFGNVSNRVDRVFRDAGRFGSLSIRNDFKLEDLSGSGSWTLGSSC